MANRKATKRPQKAGDLSAKGRVVTCFVVRSAAWDDGVSSPRYVGWFGVYPGAWWGKVTAHRFRTRKGAEFVRRRAHRLPYGSPDPRKFVVIPIVKARP